MEITKPHNALLPLRDLMDYVSFELEVIPAEKRCYIQKEQVLYYILEELCVALSDREAISPIDQAVAYLKQFQVDEQTAGCIAFNILHMTISVVSGAYPRLTYLEISKAKFVMIDPFTLRVTFDS